MKRLRILALLLAALGLAALMPTRESLCLDENATLAFVSQDTFPHLLSILNTSHDSLSQMPLGVLVGWGWVRLGATSEWGLRSLNIAWVLAGLAAMHLTGRRLRLPLLPLWFALQPFLWFYANEFRPYALQIAGSAWVLHGLTACLQDRGRGSAWAWSLALGGVVMAGATLIGALPLAVALLILARAFRGWRTLPDRGCWLPLGLGLALLLALGLHGLATLARGSGGARLWEVTFLNPLFAAYELLGFIGLGPPRLEIREAARAGLPALLALFTGSLAGIGALGLTYLLILFPLWKRIGGDRGPVIPAVAGLAGGPILILLAVAWLMGWPFWGRHLSPVLPFSTCLVAWLADRASRTAASPRAARLIPILLAALLVTSALSIRFSSRHRKDDYRGAVARARAAAEMGETVWWAADRGTARHYGLPFNESTGEGGVIYLATTFKGDAGSLADPGLVFTSKPDIYDRNGRLAAWLQLRNYRVKETLPGFTLWSRP